MRRKIYRTVTAATVIACAVLVFVTWYVVGIVEKDNTMNILESRVSTVSDILYKRESKYSSISSQIGDEYQSKTRTLAIMLSKNTNIMEDELLLEEIRMIAGADSISIFDENLKLEHEIGVDTTNENIIQKFTPAIDNKLFSSSQIKVDGNVIKVIVGCSRLDKSGIVMAEYIYGSTDKLEIAADISEILVNMPIMETGKLAVIDNESMKYAAHTDKDKIGMPSGFDLKSDFFSRDDFFDCKIDGEEVLLHFKFCNNNLAIGYIPYSEIYHIRNYTIKWVIAVGIIISCVVTLTFRSIILHIKKKEKKNKI